MDLFRSFIGYVASLRSAKIVLWCYLAWYFATVTLYFDARPSIWMNSLGISAIVGTALLLSVKRGPGVDGWQVFRLFMMPFGVSSFSALIKNRGFVLVFAPDVEHLAIQVGACVLVLALVFALKAIAGRRFASVE